MLAQMHAQFAAQPGESRERRTLSPRRTQVEKEPQTYDLWRAWKWQTAGARIERVHPYSRGGGGPHPTKPSGESFKATNSTNDILPISEAAGLRSARPRQAPFPMETEGKREGSRSHAHDGHAGHDPSGEGEGARDVDLDAAVKLATDPEWRQRFRTTFIKKFYTPGTLAAKNTKRKRIGEVMEALETEFRLNISDLVGLASVLDSTGMKASDQYLSEAKSMHIEAGHSWSDVLETHMTMCKRALRRGKGPGVQSQGGEGPRDPGGEVGAMHLSSKKPTESSLVVCLGSGMDATGG